MRIKQSKIIIDTNLWISYLITKGFKRLDKLIYSERVSLVFSQELIDEFIEVTKRPKFKENFSSNEVIRLLELFGTYGVLVKVSSDIKLCRDLKDNFLLSLAVDSQADYLITGDNDLLEIRKVGKTNLLTIKDFELLP